MRGVSVAYALSWTLCTATLAGGAPVARAQATPVHPSHSVGGLGAQGTPRSSTVAPPRRLWVAATLHASVFGDLLDRSTLLPRFGYGVRGGARFGRWGVFGLVERDHWILSELDLRYVNGVLNLAVGGELLYANRRVSASLAVGTSTLLHHQPLNRAGTTGLYVAVRPAGLRYAVLRHATVQVDLLSLVVEAPVLRFPVLVEIQYRAALTLEYGG